MQPPANATSELAQLLAALCSADAAIRGSAEEALSRARTQPGFAASLSSFAAHGTSPSVPDAVPLRQMALTQLKSVLKKNWGDIVPAEQAAIRQTLVAAVADENKSLRGLLHLCAAIALTKCQNQWPELHQRLMSGVVGGTPEEAMCCLECVMVIFEECDHPSIPAALSTLQAPMLRLAAAAESPPQLRRLCVSVYVVAINRVLLSDDSAADDADDHGQSERGLHALNQKLRARRAKAEEIVAGLPPWVEVLAALCVGLETWGDSDRIACAFTAVRAATTLCRPISQKGLMAVLADSLDNLLRPACLLVQRLGPGYESSVINMDDGGASEEEGGPAELVAQLMELVQAMLVVTKLRSLLKGHVKSLLQLVLPFMRITVAQERSMRADPNLFLAQEEDEYARGCIVRLSGESLIGELLSHSPTKRETCHAVAALSSDLLERGEQGHAAGDRWSWKYIEVALWSFGHVAAGLSLQLLQRGEIAAVTPAMLTAAGRHCANEATPDFLRARAFSLLRKLGDAVCALSASDVPMLLQAAAGGLNPAAPLVVRISACRTFCRFLTAVDDKESCKALLLERGVLAALAALLRDADEEMLHLTLDCLRVVVKRCPDAMVPVQDSLATLIAELWQRSASDPMAYWSVLDVVTCAAECDPRLQLAMAECLVPVVRAGLSQTAVAEPHAVAGGIELYGVLLKHSEKPLPAPLWSCVEPLIAAVLQSTESGLLQNACDVLCSIIRSSAGRLVASNLVAPLLQAAEHLLGPHLDDSACLFVGPFTSLLFSHFGSQLSGDLVTGILRALLARLAKAQLPLLQSELVVVFGRLLHEDFQSALAALRGLEVIVDLDTGRHVWNGFELLLAIWLANSPKFVARRIRNATVCVFCKLHARCLEEEALRMLQLRHPETAQPEAGALPQRLLEAILGALEAEVERCSRHMRKGIPQEDSSIDDDDEEIDDEDDDAEGPSNHKVGRLLSDLVDLDDDDDDDEDALPGGTGNTMEELDRSDPLYNIDVCKTSVGYLSAYAGTISPTSVPPQLAQRLQAAVVAAQPYLGT